MILATPRISLSARGLSERTVRAIGAVLLFLGLALPWIVHQHLQPRGGPLRPALITFPGGRFQMEPAGPIDTVAGFALADAPITQAQYTTVLGRTPPAATGNPATTATVPFNDAVGYCNALTHIVGGDASALCYLPPLMTPRPGCTGYRLPTQKELRYAQSDTARALWHHNSQAAGGLNKPFLIARSVAP